MFSPLLAFAPLHPAGWLGTGIAAAVILLKVIGKLFDLKWVRAKNDARLIKELTRRIDDLEESNRKLIRRDDEQQALIDQLSKNNTQLVAKVNRQLGRIQALTQQATNERQLKYACASRLQAAATVIELYRRVNGQLAEDVIDLKQWVEWLPQAKPVTLTGIVLPPFARPAPPDDTGAQDQRL